MLGSIFCHARTALHLKFSVYLQVPMTTVLSQELRFVFKCKGSTKPVRKKASDSEVGNASNNLYGSDVYNYTGKNPLTWLPDVASHSDVTDETPPWMLPSYVPPPPSPIDNLHASTANQNASTSKENSCRANQNSPSYCVPNTANTPLQAANQSEETCDAASLRQRKNW